MATPAGCAKAAARPDGTCCAAGEAWIAADAACAAVGPAVCAAVALSAPETCTPVVADGCAAGEVKAAEGACVATAAFAPADLGAVVAPPGVPDVAPLPALTQTAFCADAQPCVVAGVAAACPPGFVASGAGCAPDPADCVDGDATAAWHVAPTGKDTNTGKIDAPLKTIAKAIALAVAGDTIRIEAGTYTENLTLAKAVTLRGRCAHDVRIVGSAGSPVLAVTTQGAGQVVLRGLTFQGEGFGVEISGTTPAQVERIAIDGVRRAGLLINHGQVDVRSTLVTGTRPLVSDGTLGWGLGAQGGATVTLQDVRLSGNRHLGFSALGTGTHVTATRLWIDGTLPQQSDGKLGVGAAVGKASFLSVSEARITHSHGAAFWVSGDGSQADITRLVADDGQSATGRGINVDKGGKLTLQDTRLSGHKGGGVFVAGTGSVMNAKRVLIDGPHARGITVQDGGKLTLSDSRLSANRDVAMRIAGGSTVVTLDRVLVDGTLPSSQDGTIGRGIDVSGGADLTLTAVRLSANRDIGLRIYDDGTTVTAKKLLVDGTFANGAGEFGRGIDVAAGAHLTLTDARLTANHYSGLLIDAPGSEVIATRVIIDGTLPQPADKVAGMAIDLQNGAHLQATGLWLHANRDMGLFAQRQGTLATLVDVRVDGTLPQASDQRYGRGIQVQQDAALTLTGAWLHDNGEMGVSAIRAGPVELTGVRIDVTAAGTDGRFGNGVYAGEGHAPLVMTACRVTGSHSAAVTLQVSPATLTDCVLVATAEAKYPKFGPTGAPTGEYVTLADGLVVVSSPDVTVERTLVVQNPRAGLLVKASEGMQVRHTLVTGGFFGLVLEGKPAPLVQGTLLLGSDRNVASDLGLFVPPPPELAPVNGQASGEEKP